MLALLLIASAPFCWEPSREDPDVLRCWDGPHAGRYTLHGEYDTATGVYRDWAGNPAEPPIELPAVQNFGVDVNKLRLAPRYRLSGLPVSREAALAALRGPASVQGDSKVPDRSKLPWLTVCGGSDAQRKATLEAIPADVRDKYRVNSYPAGHWALRPGFRCSESQVTLYVQRAGGEVLHRQDDGEVTPGLVAQLREPDPKYDPARDADRRKASPALPQLPGVLGKVPPPLLAGAGLVLLLALVNWRKDEK